MNRTVVTLAAVFVAFTGGMVMSRVSDREAPLNAPVMALRGVRSRSPRHARRPIPPRRSPGCPTCRQ